mgnify:CR=1 FL=1
MRFSYKKLFPSPFGESFRKYAKGMVVSIVIDAVFPSPFGESFRKFLVSVLLFNVFKIRISVPFRGII